MTSYVFTVIEKRYYWDKVHEILAEKYDDGFELIFAVRKSCPEKADLLTLEKQQKNVKVLEFEDTASENKMIDTAIKQTRGLDMVLCRDYFEYDTIKSDYFLAMAQYNTQVILFKKERKTNKFKDFFTKVYNKLIKFIFGFSPYDADIGLMYFSNIAVDVLKALPSSTLLTKVNKWAGFDVSYITIEELETPKLEKTEKKALVIWTSVLGFFMSVIIAGFVLLAVFGKLGFVLGLLFIFCFVIVAFMLNYTLLKLKIVCKYGDLKD
jgi:hypothetical protein